MLFSNINLLARKKFIFQFLFLLSLSSVFNSCIKPSFELSTPINKCVLNNNMPNFTWQAVECDHYEVWIDDIKMAEVPGMQSTYTPFNLSFGEHEWYVKAISENKKEISSIGKFIVDDKPLEQLPEHAVLLRDNWKVKSALEVEETGEELTYHIINTDDWAPTTIPCTALSALVRNGLYPNPLSTTNTMRIPDASDSFNTAKNLIQYSHIKGKNPWKEKYWFRTQFVKPIYAKGKKTFLHLNGLNYKAELWINGELVADTSKLIGMGCDYTFKISKYDKGKNIMAIAIYPPDHINQPFTPQEEDSEGNQTAIAPDRNMGIIGDVYLTFADKIEIQDLYVTSDLQVPDTSKADVSLNATILNISPLEVTGTVQATLSIDDTQIVAEQKFHIDAQSKKKVKFNSAKFKQLTIDHPKLWWPSGYGKQNLYEVQLTATTDELNRTSTENTMFGIRKVETNLNNNELVYTINGKRIDLKEGNWTNAILLNRTASLYEKEIKKTKADGFNLLRVLGSTSTPPQAFYDAADREGILIVQDIFDGYRGTSKKEQVSVSNEKRFIARTIDVIKKYRNHPCLVQWYRINNDLPLYEKSITEELLSTYDKRGNRPYISISKP